MGDLWSNVGVFGRNNQNYETSNIMSTFLNDFELIKLKPSWNVDFCTKELDVNKTLRYDSIFNATKHDMENACSRDYRCEAFAHSQSLQAGILCLSGDVRSYTHDTKLCKKLLPIISRKGTISGNLLMNQAWDILFW